MFRNEKTGRFESEKVDVKEEEPSYGYYSKVLNKPFDTVTELAAAEAAYKKAEDEKRQIAEAKKAEAKPVEEAIDAYEEGKVACNDIIAKAYAEYKEKVTAAEKELAKLEQNADNLLKEFQANHPEGFHYTYRSKDGKVVRTYNYYNKRFDVFDNYDRFVKLINDLWF